MLGVNIFHIQFISFHSEGFVTCNQLKQTNDDTLVLYILISLVVLIASTKYSIPFLSSKNLHLRHLNEISNGRWGEKNITCPEHEYQDN